MMRVSVPAARPRATAGTRALASWRRRGSRLGRGLFVVGVGLDMAATAVRILVRTYYVFLPDYVRWLLTPAPAVGDRPTHLLFLFVDHFEPSRDAARVHRWTRRYEELARRHRDSDGPPRHTLFYPVEQTDPGVFRALLDMITGEFGEVELHFHHDYDTASMLRTKLEADILAAQQYGLFQSADGATHFAFIHGNWGLDNSNGPLMCGVNAELRLLRELGCYADDTFPSVYEDSQPPVVNTIYAARDDDQPKSYRTPLPISAVEDGAADLVIFQGPLVFAPSLRPRRLFLDLNDGDIHGPQPSAPYRVDRWVRANIHVAERPDWVFIKVFAHGISSPEDEEVVVGRSFDQTLTYLKQHYNDGRRYVLHDVTAREAYNLVRAASDGVRGEPEEYLDYVIPPYRAGRAAAAARAALTDSSAP